MTSAQAENASDVRTPVSKADVESFIAASGFLHASRMHFERLYEGGDLRTEILSRTAPILFGDLAQVLKEYLILQICRLTDPERMNGNDNLTVSFLVNNSDFLHLPEEGKRLRELGNSIHRFRKLLAPARHKFISHHDRNAVLAGDALGAAPREAWKQFWQDLRDFIQILHQRYVDPDVPFDLYDVGGVSDADMLIKALSHFHIAQENGEIALRLSEISLASRYRDA